MAAQAVRSGIRGLRRKMLRRRLPEIVLGALALAGYVFYLNQQDARVQAHFEKTRREAPQTYLDELRVVRGFNAYLEAYAEIHGTDRFGDRAPEFLLGRWAVFDRPLRVDDRFSTTSCRNAVLVENGRLTLPDATGAVPAEYRLFGNRVFIRTRDRQDEIIIRLIASGIYLHHLEFDRGDGRGIGYAYRCA